MKIMVECGQRWWRPRSWRCPNFFRRLPGARGFAVGPIIFYGGERKPAPEVRIIDPTDSAPDYNWPFDEVR